METLYCLVTDDSGHWYCIPVDFKHLFEVWMSTPSDYSATFDKFRLNMHISNYCFTNFQEIK